MRIFPGSSLCLSAITLFAATVMTMGSASAQTGPGYVTPDGQFVSSPSFKDGDYTLDRGGYRYGQFSNGRPPNPPSFKDGDYMIGPPPRPDFRPRRHSPPSFKDSFYQLYGH